METIDGRAKLAEMARPLVNKLPDGVYRELLIDGLASSVGLTAAKLEAMLAKDKSNTAGARNSGHTVSARATRMPVAGQPSVVRRAITLLLNYPQAGRELDTEKLAGVNRPGTDLLAALIETVQQEPNITTAGLLERWRHDEKGRHLGKLAAADVPLDEDFDTAAELGECLQQLALAGRKERIDYLIEKHRVGGLDETEKSELRALH